MVLEPMSERERKKRSREANARWRAKNPSHAHDYYMANRKKLLARQKWYRKAHYTKALRYHRRRYWRERQQVLAKVTLMCPICQRPMRRPQADHCHATAKRLCTHQSQRHCIRCRRDVLCSVCNRMLSLAQEQSTILQRAARYLARWNKILKRRTN